MAKLYGPFYFNGSLSNLTVYRRRDVKQPIVRTKWGPSKEQINHDPHFANTKRNTIEWGGCTKGSKWIRRVLHPLDAVRDYNLAGTLSGLLKPIQQLDTEGVYGQRSVLLSRHPHLLEGFTLSRQTPLDSIVHTPLACSITKDALSARVEVPALLPGVNFSPHTPHPYFRILASLGVVPDLHYTPYGYAPDEQHGANTPVVAQTEWLGVKSGAPETALELSLPYAVEFPSFSLVLAVAVIYGTLDVLGNVQAVKYSGSGRIAVVA